MRTKNSVKWHRWLSVSSTASVRWHHRSSSKHRCIVFQILYHMIQTWATKAPHIWQDEFWSITCYTIEIGNNCNFRVLQGSVETYLIMYAYKISSEIWQWKNLVNRSTFCRSYDRKSSYYCFGLTCILWINVKKLQFIHTVNGDRSKTAKIIKRQC